MTLSITSLFKELPKSFDRLFMSRETWDEFKKMAKTEGQEIVEGIFDHAEALARPQGVPVYFSPVCPFGWAVATDREGRRIVTYHICDNALTATHAGPSTKLEAAGPAGVVRPLRSRKGRASRSQESLFD